MIRPLTTLTSKRYRNICNLSRGFMQIRIRHLYRAAPETVQRATHAFAAPIENMGIDHASWLDSVPFSVLQKANSPENLHSWLQKSWCNRYLKYILKKSDLQEKIFPRRYIHSNPGICHLDWRPLQTSRRLLRAKVLKCNTLASYEFLLDS